MRDLMIVLVGVALLCVQADAASAYAVSLVPTTPTIGSVGDVVSFDFFLDTEGDVGLNTLSVSITYDPTVVAYRPDLSGTNSYYPFYAPGVGKYPTTWLVPVPYDGNPCSLEERICANPPPRTRPASRRRSEAR